MSQSIPFRLSNQFAKILPVALVFILLAICVYGPSGDDDSHITYSAAMVFAETGSILNHNGEAVEQGSSLLHVFLLGLLTKVSGVQPAEVGYLFSLFFAVLSLFLMVPLCRLLDIKRPYRAVLLTTFSVSFGYWAVGGLESSLVACVLLCLCLRLFHVMDQALNPIKDGGSWLLVTLFLLVRPESPFVLIAALLAFGIFSWRQSQQQATFFLSMVVMTVSLSLAIAIIRYAYFDAFFPQPVYAKSSSLSVEKILFGLGYFLFSMQLSIIIFSLLLCGIGSALLFKSKPGNTKMLLIISICLAYLAFIVTTGGDWMTGGRFFAPLIPLMVVVFVSCLQSMKSFTFIYISILLLMACEVIFFSSKVSLGLPFYQKAATNPSLKDSDLSNYAFSEVNNVVHRRDIPLIDNLQAQVLKRLNKQSDKVVTLLSIQMGMPPYHLRKTFGDQVYFVDLRGLTTKHVTACARFGSIERRWTGVFISYQQYFDALDDCGLPKPDIVYDLLNRSERENSERLAALREKGYDIVYLHSGDISVLGGLKKLSGDVFVASLLPI